VLSLKTHVIPLNQLLIGHRAKVKEITLTGLPRRRLQDLGLIVDTVIEPLMKSPSGNPIAFNIRGATIALRSEDACHILVEEILSY
jgi:ferrous iron transport protein A